MSTIYTVQVDDNAHYLDESYRVQDGTFTSLEEAIGRCKAITDASLAELHENGMTVERLCLLYTQFGGDSWVCIEPHSGSKPPFSARSYAATRYAEMCAPRPISRSKAEDEPVDDAPHGVPGQVFAMLAKLQPRQVLEIASYEGVLLATLQAGYMLPEDKSLAPDSEEAAEAAITDERTMRVAAVTWGRLRSQGQSVLIEAMKKAVWRWEDVVELMHLWEPHELPEDREGRLRQEASEEQEWRRQQL